MDDLTLKQKIAYIGLVGAIQIFQLCGVLLIAFLNNAIFECIGIYIGMIAGKIFFTKAWHADSVFMCSLTTFGVFYMLTRSTLPSNISIFVSLALGFLLAYVLYRLAIMKEQARLYTESKKDINNLTFEELQQLCYTKSISETDTRFLYDYLKKPNGETNEGIANKYHYCDGHYVSRRAKRLIKKING